MKLASVAPSFSDELQKIANGDMLQYFQDHPEKLREKQKRDKAKLEKRANPLKNAILNAFDYYMSKTAEITPYQQKTQWTCSAACLKAVLAHHGQNLPELALIKAIDAKKGRGAECDQIANAARALGFDAFEFSFQSIEQADVLLKQHMPIICDIQSFNNPGKGHYVVLEDFNGTHVKLMDPNTPGNTRIISRQEMDERWWDRAMAPPHQDMPKWGIVVLPPEVNGDPSSK